MALTPDLNGHSTIFCIFTGAEVTIILKKAYSKIGNPEMKTLDKTLKGLSSDRLACKGHFMGYLQNKAGASGTAGTVLAVPLSGIEVMRGRNVRGS